MLKSAFSQKRVGPTERNKLIAGIHAQAHALQLPDDVRKDLQLKLVGVESTKHMTVAQLSAVWSRLTTLAQDAGLGHAASRRREGRAGENDKPRARKRPGRDERLPADPPTNEQLELIEHLYDDLGIRPSADMMALARRITGHPWPQTREEANKLIEGMKAMKERGWRARGNAGRNVEGSVLADRAVADSPRSMRAGEPSIVTPAGGEE